MSTFTVFPKCNKKWRCANRSQSVYKRKTRTHSISKTLKKQLASDSVSELIICEKAAAVATLFMTKKGHYSRQFKATRNWFEKFRRLEIHSVISDREGDSSRRSSLN
ncbi:Uncharacterised protein r2_g1236 [Pycnogonum litorale]